jgi:hypothetical protein
LFGVQLLSDSPLSPIIDLSKARQSVEFSARP